MRLVREVVGEAERTIMEFDGEVRTMILSPGDAIVVRLSGRPNATMTEMIRENLEGLFPNHKVIVYDTDVELSVLKEVSE